MPSALSSLRIRVDRKGAMGGLSALVARMDRLGKGGQAAHGTRCDVASLHQRPVSEGPRTAQGAMGGLPALVFMGPARADKPPMAPVE